MFPLNPIPPAHGAAAAAPALPPPNIDLTVDLISAGFAIPEGAQTQTTPSNAEAIRHVLHRYPAWVAPLPWLVILIHGHDATAIQGCLAMMQMGLIDGPANESDPNCKEWMKRFIQNATENDFHLHPNGLTIEARITALLNAGAEIDDPNLIWAAATAPCDHSLRALVEAGADIDAEHTDGMNALHRACQESNPNAVQRLIAAGADVGRHSSDIDIGTPMIVAAGVGHAEIITALILSGADLHDGPNGRTPLHEAVVMGQYGVATILVWAGADPNRTCDEGQTPLHELSDLYCEDIYNTISVLMRLGANPNIRNDDGDTPLHLMVENNHEECLLALLSHDGVDVDAPNANGQTPLRVAAELGFGDICHALLSSGASRHLRDHQGQSALDVATDAVRPMLEYDPGPAQSGNGRASR